jgi:hypothetical protein
MVDRTSLLLYEGLYPPTRQVLRTSMKLKHVEKKEHKDTG